MSQLSKIRRTAIDGYLKAVRAPLDAGMHLATRGNDERLTSARLVVDRADATIRQQLGRILSDDELLSDGVRRAVATDERVRALELKAVADEKSRRATVEFRKRQDRLEREQTETERKAAEDRRRAQEARQQEEAKAADAAQRRKAASRKIEAAVEQRVATEARSKRVEQLDTEADALQAEEDALRASERARQLKAKADSVKSARKSKPSPSRTSI